MFTMLHGLSGAVVTVTGGTGSFGSTMVNSLLNTSAKEIRILSRDELKQEIMRNTLRDERLKFYIGDVRDYGSLKSAIKGSDFVFHAAALKQVPTCEFFPIEAVKTNVLGSSNVIEASYEFEVKKIVCLSTDKAVSPINVMGSTKQLMEKIAQSYARDNSSTKTKIAITRYGNVMMSRGSVIPLFLSQIDQRKPITITDPNMTRFVMSLEEAVALVTFAFLHAESGDLIVKKARSCSIGDLARAVCKLRGVEFESHHEIIGARHGEKNFETLLTSEELLRSIDKGDFFVVPLDERRLDYRPYIDEGEVSRNALTDYTSSNTIMLNIDELTNVIKELPQFLGFFSGDQR